MTNKPVSLIQLTNLKGNKELSETFVRYIGGLPPESKYRHQEIKDIALLLKNLKLPEDRCSDFIYGYTIPQFNQEFDLLKISADHVINIELKSGMKSKEEIEKQLKRHKHFLKLLQGEAHLFTFVSSENKLYKLDIQGLRDCSFDELHLYLCSSSPRQADLDDVFAPKNVLVSPLNDTKKFINGDYLLTENQENIKKELIKKIKESDSHVFFGLTGLPGTGKTLLLYDIARTLATRFKVLIIHAGKLCAGHYSLENNIDNIEIHAAKDLNSLPIKDADFILVDEAQRLYERTLSVIECWTIKTKAVCLFSYDPDQRLSYSERNSQTVARINNLCQDKIKELPTKIRTNKEVALFIQCLFNLKLYKNNFSFPHIKLFFEPNKESAVKLAKSLSTEDYQYIALTPSNYKNELDYQMGKMNSHNVIGQEFDKVSMVMDEHFFYDEKNHLSAAPHPNPDYICTQLLYQGLTRARIGIALVVTTEHLVEKILPLLAGMKTVH